jgi:hypothetical protein
MLDELGLILYDETSGQAIINDGADALAYWKSKQGGTAIAGEGLILQLKMSKPFLDSKQETVAAIEKQIRALGRSVLCPSGASGTVQRTGSTIGVSNWFGNFSVGSINLNVKDYDANWTNAGVGFTGFATIKYSAQRNLSFKDRYEWNASWNRPKTWLTDVVPEIIAGDGASFDIEGGWSDHITGQFTLCCWGF